MMKWVCSTVICALLGFSLSAQELFPEPGEVFRDDIVGEVRITIDPDSLAAIYANPESDHEYPAEFYFNNGTVEESLSLVGFRLRGNTSRLSQKKSFKVAFNSFDKSQKFYGLEKMNLNGEHNDPSVIRSKLCWDICRELEVPASRSNHIQLYINDDYWGLYINVEHVDEEFVELRFGNKTGNLYKCLWPASLNWRGSDPDEYKFENGNRRTYELKTNEEYDDYNDLAQFINVLNNTPIDRLDEELPLVFNIETYLSAMVMDIFTGNWDGPLYNKNNFYLYHNDENGLFEYIPYDLDNTLGVDWMGVDWTSRNVYEWSPSYDFLPLYERIMAVPAFRLRFTQIFRKFLDEFVQSGDLEDEILSLKQMISGYIPDDPFYPLDYGWDADDFADSYYHTPGQHVKYGLIPYINNRMTTAYDQLDQVSSIELADEISQRLKVYPNPADDLIFIEAPVHALLILRQVDGRKVAEFSSDHQLVRIRTDNLVAGLYILEMIPATGQPGNQKIIIR